MIPQLKEIGWLFLKLGIFAFGGPAAHIAMMQDEVVRRKEWMTEDQEQLLNIYGWVAVAIMALVLLSFVLRNVNNVVKQMKGGYSPPGEDMNIAFSENKSVDAYLPFSTCSLRYPLLLFDVSKVDPYLFSWTDPDRPHSHYDVTKDLTDILDGSEIKATHLFAKVRHWPPQKGS